MLQSSGVLTWTLLNLPLDWNILKALTLILMIISGVFIFTGIFMLAATLCFWTVQAIEIANVFTDGGREMAQYGILFIIPCLYIWNFGVRHYRSTGS